MLKVLYLTSIKYCLPNIIVLFTFVHNSLIFVMLYKVYNELHRVGAAAKTLILVMLYNVCNVIE